MKEDADKLRTECWKMIHVQCILHVIYFEIQQCSAHFIKDRKRYTLKVRDLCNKKVSLTLQPPASHLCRN